MKVKWSIDYYIPSSGGLSPLVSFIEGLSEKAQAKLSNTFSLLKDFGTQVREPHAIKLTRTPLWELRILGKDNIRLFYIISKKETFLLLHGFIKKKQKTPRKEIGIALKRLKDYQERVKSF